MRTLIVIVSSVVIFGACQKANEDFEQVKNDGRVIVMNGQGLNDTLAFKGVGCIENITDTAVFNALIKEASERTKGLLTYPLAYNPQKLEVTVTKQDSLFNFETNEQFINTFLVRFKMNYLSKNVFGTEIEGTNESLFYIVDNKVVDLKEKIKLDSLKFNDDGLINRTLNLCSGCSDEHINIVPTDNKTFVVSSSISCIDKGAFLTLHLENNQKVKLVSWNDFNCEGSSYFKDLNPAQIQKLKTYKIKYISLIGQNSIACVVPMNESDYFMQLIKLLYVDE